MDYLLPCVLMVLSAALWEGYLSWRQRNIYKTVTKVPHELVGVLKQETFDKSRRYQLDKSNFDSIHSLYKVAEFMVIIYMGVLPIVWDLTERICSFIGYDYEVLQTAVFMLISLVYSDITELPWVVYYTFVLEEKHGFNKQTAGFFIKDKIKKFILKCLLVSPIVAGLVAVIKWGGAYFYIYAWVFVFAVVMIFIMVYHDFIAPCFDKYTPLPDGELKERIEGLASSLKFPLKKLYVVEGSKRSAHSNAYFYGFGSNKRIVLFDTLLEKGLCPEHWEKENKPGEEQEGKENKQGEKQEEEENKQGEKQEEEENKPGEEQEGKDKPQEEKESVDDNTEEKATGCSIEEILAILSHELGHWQYSHTIKFIVLSQVNMFISFVLFGYFLNQDDVYFSFGFSSRPVIIGLIIVFEMIFTPYNFLFTFITVQLGRRFEYQADEFAVQMKKAPALADALTKLVKDNLAFPVADSLYANFHNVHPTLLERIRVLKTKTD